MMVHFLLADFTANTTNWKQSNPCLYLIHRSNFCFWQMLLYYCNVTSMLFPNLVPAYNAQGRTLWLETARLHSKAAYTYEGKNMSLKDLNLSGVYRFKLCWGMPNQA